MSEWAERYWPLVVGAFAYALGLFTMYKSWGAEHRALKDLRKAEALYEKIGRERDNGVLEPWWTKGRQPKESK